VTGRAGPWARLRSWFRSSAELEAAELRDRSRALDAVPCAEAEPGGVVTVAGTLRTVTLRPRTGVPALEAELYDGSGVVLLVWLGRRGVRGVTPGRSVVARGRITTSADRRTMYNPTYELLPAGS
jgi:hypothetical protein